MKMRLINDALTFPSDNCCRKLAFYVLRCTYFAKTHRVDKQPCTCRGKSNRKSGPGLKSLIKKKKKKLLSRKNKI